MIRGASPRVRRWLRAPDAAWIRYRAPILDGLAIGGVALTGWLLVGGGYGWDLFAYWNVDPTDPYQVDRGFGAFHYAPVVAWLAVPLKALPFEAAFWAYTGIEVAILAVLGRRYALAWLAFPPVAVELFHGNVHLLLALALWLGLRWPAAWAALLLTKLSPGVVLLWFVARGEWRNLAIAVGVAALVAIPSILLQPAVWSEWMSHLVGTGIEVDRAGNSIHVPVTVRVAMAALIVIWGARTDRRWTLAVAATLALPILWIHGLAMLAALTPLMREDRRRQRHGTSPIEPSRPASTSPTLGEAQSHGVP